VYQNWLETNRLQDNGTQVAVQTIYRELDRARALIKKHAKQDDDQTEVFEEDWTLVDEGEEAEVPLPAHQKPSHH
jgi:sterol 3beta-glucosyltransferase